MHGRCLAPTVPSDRGARPPARSGRSIHRTDTGELVVRTGRKIRHHDLQGASTPRTDPDAKASQPGNGVPAQRRAPAERLVRADRRRLRPGPPRRDSHAQSLPRRGAAPSAVRLRHSQGQRGGRRPVGRLHRYDRVAVRGIDSGHVATDRGLLPRSALRIVTLHGRPRRFPPVPNGSWLISRSRL